MGHLFRQFKSCFSWSLPLSGRELLESDHSDFFFVQNFKFGQLFQSAVVWGWPSFQALPSPWQSVALPVGNQLPTRRATFTGRYTNFTLTSDDCSQRRNLLPCRQRFNDPVHTDQPSRLGRDRQEMDGAQLSSALRACLCLCRLEWLGYQQMHSSKSVSRYCPTPASRLFSAGRTWI